MTEAGQRDAGLVRRCRRIATATWSDALDGLGIEGVMDGITPRSAGQRIAGPAVTAHEETAGLGGYALADFDLGAIVRAAPAGSVVVITMSGAPVSTFGGLAARSAAGRRIAGIVIDGGCRDLREVQESGIFLASRHVTPRSGKRRAKVVGLGAVVSCGGVMVRSDDFVIADETGIVVVPRERLIEALSVAEQMDANDRRFKRELATGAEFGDVAARLGHL